MELKTIFYIVYLILSISITIWVAKTLFSNGYLFILSMLKDEDLTKSLSKLLLVGFYLINIGYILETVKSYANLQDWSQLIESLGEKLGGILLILGAMHFLNILIFYRIRKKSLQKPLKVTKPQVVRIPNPNE